MHQFVAIEISHLKLQAVTSQSWSDLGQHRSEISARLDKALQKIACRGCIKFFHISENRLDRFALLGIENAGEAVFKFRFQYRDTFVLSLIHI